MKQQTAMVVYLLITALISFSHYSRPPKSTHVLTYTHYNNYTNFKCSYFHLIDNKDLYAEYPEEYWDLFKYSPTFALAMGLLAYLPDLAGLIIWNLANALLLFLAISKMDFLSTRSRVLMQWLALPELLITIQNAQSNGLTVAFMLFALIYFEKGKYIQATAFVAGGFFVKIYGVISGLLALFYKKYFKSALGFILSFVALAVLPLVVIGIDQYEFLINSWWNVLTYDAGNSEGLSVLGWIKNWFGIDPSKTILIGGGGLLMLLPLIKLQNWKERLFRIKYFAALCVWIIIFNHRAESPTFIIAMTGAVLWWVVNTNNLYWNIVFWSTWVLSSWSPTDLFPAIVRNELIIPYSMKAFPYIIMWTSMIYQLFTHKKESPKSKNEQLVLN